MIAMVASWSVTGSFCSTRSTTGTLRRMDSPRSPVTDALDPEEILDRQRLIEAILLADLGDDLGIAILARHDQGGIARQQLLQQEDDHRHEENGRDELQQALAENP